LIPKSESSNRLIPKSYSQNRLIPKSESSNRLIPKSYSQNRLIPKSESSNRLIPERRCANGKLTYEKTTGYELIRATPTRLFTSKDGGIIADCGSRYVLGPGRKEIDLLAEITNRT
jgi:hypothetical protein